MGKKMNKLIERVCKLEKLVKFLSDDCKNKAIVKEKSCLYGINSFIEYIYDGEIREYKVSTGKCEIVKNDYDRIVFKRTARVFSAFDGIHEETEYYLLDKSTNHAVSLGNLDEENKDE